jgi:hypothetical protein
MNNVTLTPEQTYKVTFNRNKNTRVVTAVFKQTVILANFCRLEFTIVENTTLYTSSFDINTDDLQYYTIEQV